ncbi:type 1 glutamine amidotransferase domain-containing protein [Acidithiobacillus marinus]|uniref:type 1 glutamine amidotransferase domain-containing protein n=1 Tax=Acidithiobacillus marinus TaxID=187490 RepID=UPI0015569D13|nr:type 1 glutamine amidotransferase domain-containing protein [Acidithiobacillus marinus]
MFEKPYILFLLTGARVLTLLDGEQLPTGFWAEELVIPWQLLKQSDWSLYIATPDGRLPELDPESLDPANLQGDIAKAVWLKTQVSRIPELKTVLSLKDMTATQLENMHGLFIPGGNGPLVDLAVSPEVARLLRHCHDQQKVLATLCHGSAALLAADHAASPYVACALTCFSAAEEAATALAGRWPYTLEERLRNAGFLVSVGECWQSHIVKDAKMLSGQNPTSAPALTEAFMERLLITDSQGKNQ